MKYLFSIISCLAILVSSGQDCKKNALMNSGTQLEYRIYGLKENSRKDFDEITRKTYVVDSVVESGGLTISNITVKNRAVKCDMGFDKKITVTCNGKELLWDFEALSGADTIYMCDKMPDKVKAYRTWATTTFKAIGKINELIFPIELKEGMDLQAGQSFELKTTQKTPETYSDMYRNGGMPKMYQSNPYGFTGALIDQNINGTITIKKVTVGKKSKVKTTAGEFDCFEIISTMEYVFGPKMKASQQSVIFYAPEVGMVKCESQVNGFKMFYYELYSIKK